MIFIRCYYLVSVYAAIHKTVFPSTFLSMSPVSPVFHTVVTVRIGLKTQLELEHLFPNTKCSCWSAERCSPSVPSLLLIHPPAHCYSISFLFKIVLLWFITLIFCFFCKINNLIWYLPTHFAWRGTIACLQEQSSNWS